MHQQRQQAPHFPVSSFFSGIMEREQWTSENRDKNIATTPSRFGKSSKGFGEPKTSASVPEAQDCSTYRDRYIQCTDANLIIYNYYFPAGNKTIPLINIRNLERVPLQWYFGGRGRIWGTASPGVWAHLDPMRPKKTEGLLLDIGQSTRPLITPNNVPLLIKVLVHHTGLTVHQSHGTVV